MRNRAMTAWDRRVAATLVAAAVTLVAAVSGAFPARAEDPNPQLWSRLQRIESAFRGGDAGALRPSFPSTGKVRVDLRSLTEGPASYGSGQLQVIFEQIFDEHRTREFAFRKQDVTVPAPGTAFAKGRWVRRTRTGGQESVDTLTFTLREENRDWRIHEILTSR